MKEAQEQTEKTSVFKEWADATTAHGFVDFCRSKTVVGKVIWFVLILISFTLMVYQLYQIGNDYSKNEWITTTKEQSPDNGAEMPRIIICNMNRLKWSKATEYNLTSELISHLFLATTPWNGFGKNQMYSKYSKQFIAWQRAQNLTFLEIFEKMGPNYHDIFIQDVFASAANIDGNSSSAGIEIDSIYTQEYGQCQRLNLNIYSQVVGSIGGVSMILDVQSWDYIPLLYNNYAGEGLLIQLNYAGYAEIGQWIKLHPGTQTSIALNPVESTVRLQNRSTFNPFAYLDSTPPCVISPKLRIFDDSRYSQVTCYVECDLMPIVRGCGCVPLYQSDRFRTCEIVEYLSCMSSASKDYSTEEQKEATLKSNEESEQCYNACLVPCYHRSVETQVSQAKFPSRSQQSQLQEYLDKKNLSAVQIEDIILLDIYFSSITTKLVERYEEMSFEDLISNTGGLIGLWAGMSFLTIFQAISYLIKYFEEKELFAKLNKKAKVSSEKSIEKSMYVSDSDISVPNIH